MNSRLIWYQMVTGAHDVTKWISPGDLRSRSHFYCITAASSLKSERLAAKIGKVVLSTLAILWYFIITKYIFLKRKNLLFSSLFFCTYFCIFTTSWSKTRAYSNSRCVGREKWNRHPLDRDGVIVFWRLSTKILCRCELRSP